MGCFFPIFWETSSKNHELYISYHNIVTFKYKNEKNNTDEQLKNKRAIQTDVAKKQNISRLKDSGLKKMIKY